MIEKLIANLTSLVKEQREEAVRALAELPPQQTLQPVSDILLQDHEEPIYRACLDLLQKMGAVVSLDQVRTDGWFEQLGARILNFDRICDVMGRRFLAYSIILGLQIRSLNVDPRFPVNTRVDYTTDGKQPQSLTLGEFRLRVVQTLIQEHRPIVENTLPLSVTAATAILGGRNLLLAPLFGISLERLVATTVEPGEIGGIVGFSCEDGFSYARVSDFNILIFEKLKEDLSDSQEEPFKLDLDLVSIAREAFERGDIEKVLSTLDAWPGLLSILLKTPMARSLEEGQREAIGEGLEILGASFEKMERDPWSEELYKLGLQFSKEGTSAARLYLRLGLLLLKLEKYGEAIGPLRRALKMHDDKETALCALARAFLKRGKTIPAAALLEYAAAKEWEFPGLDADLKEVRKRLKAAGLGWNIPLMDQEIVGL